MKGISIAAMSGLAALVLTSAAEAKQITSVRICGASACHDFDEAALRVWLDGGFEDRWGYPTGSYYRLSLGWGEGTKTVTTTRTIWIPRARLIRHWGMPAGAWWRVSASQQALLMKAARGIPPAGQVHSGVAAGAQHLGAGGPGLYAGLAVAGLAGVGALAAFRTQTRRRRKR